MPRRPDGAVARPFHLTTRLSAEEKAELEAKRGAETASEWVRDLIHRAPSRKDPS